jgi:hypothetical protein
MKIIAKVLDRKILEISEAREFLEFVLLSLASFFIPFLIGHPQFLVGVLVNMALVRGAMTLSNKKLIPLVFLPSLAVIARGLIFGPFTVFLLYLLPFIWLGNIILISAIRKLKNKNISVQTVLPALIKAGTIGSAAFILIKLSILPGALLFGMTIIQFATAIIATASILLFASLENFWQSKKVIDK